MWFIVQPISVNSAAFIMVHHQGCDLIDPVSYFTGVSCQGPQSFEISHDRSGERYVGVMVHF